MLIGAVIAAAWAVVVMWLYERGRHLTGPAVGFPGVLFVAGVVEVVSGRSIAELAQRWDELKGWQRGILGLVIVATSTAVIVLIAGTVVVILADRSEP